MRRNTVAVIGSAGVVPASVRRVAESLGCALAEAGFDIVTGGMDGVMRAVARGHGRSRRATNLVHVEPGWGRPWTKNPHPAAVVRTGMGSMRNHLVIRSADLVVAVCGGAGTLSEMAIAWQEERPVAALRGTGGWSHTVADMRLDERRAGSITGCDTVAEVLDWAKRLRPEGVYGGRVNSGFYPHEVPVLHRIHDGAPDIDHRVHLRYGMAIRKSDAARRLQELNRRVEKWNRENDAAAVALVTFDDGWCDAMLLARDLERLPHLCPVLFVGEGHFADPVRPLPLQRLYRHCADRGLDPEDRAILGVATRSNLKKLRETEQHAALDRLDIDPMSGSDRLLAAGDLAELQAAGWVVASHGHGHEDLAQRTGLHDELVDLAATVEERGHMPWLAWPEGQWSAQAWKAARAAGFQLQFGLQTRPGARPRERMVMRSVWR